MELSKLKEVFHPDDIEWRVSRAGTNNGKPWAFVLAYVTNRAIMDRLDSVCGVENWKNEYCKAPEGGILCGISIKIGDEWVTKWDGAENSNIDPVKGGLSGAMKRAGVQWGIGRYLYNLTEMYAAINDNGKHYQSANQSKGIPAFKWDAPRLPEFALPKQGFNRQNAIEEIDKAMKAMNYPPEEVEIVKDMVNKAEGKSDFASIYKTIMKENK